MRPSGRRAHGWLTVALLVAVFLGVEIVALRLPADATWDTQNYHLYTPFALLHGKLDKDIAAAQMQTYLAPTLDIPSYFVARHIHSTTLANAILAIPNALAGCLAFLIAVAVLPGRDIISQLIAALATLIGLTGAATLPVLATRMSDMGGVVFVLAGILLLLRERDLYAPSARRIGVAAGLVGMAAGLKLTLACAAAGFAVGTLTIPGPVFPDRARRLFALAAGGGAGALVTGGWWWWIAWHHWGNPFFPFFNEIFRSPLVAFIPFRDTRFLPRSPLSALLLPVLVAGPSSWKVHFHAMVSDGGGITDPRFAIALLSAAILFCKAMISREGWANRFLPAFFIATFVIWEAQFSIWRYLSAIELLTGTLLALLLMSFAGRSLGGRCGVLACMTLLSVGLCAFTGYDYVGRARAGSPLLQVTIPRVSDTAMVVLLDGAPMAYLALFEPQSVRFVGANNNLVQPGAHGLLNRQVADAIRQQDHDLWGLESPAYEHGGGEADRTLTDYGLRRTSCTRVGTNFVHADAIFMCSLRHVVHSESGMATDGAAAMQPASRAVRPR